MIARLLFALAGLAAAPLEAGSMELPKNKLGTMAADFLKLCDAPKAAELTRFFADHFSAQTLKTAPAEDTAKIIGAQCRAHGGFSPRSILKSEDTKLVVQVQGKTSEVWSRLVLINNAQGQLIMPELIMPTPPPESTIPKDLSDAAFQKALDSEMQRLGKLELFSGIVAVARGPQPFALSTAGYADRTKKTPITGSTQFTIASMGKLFTAVAIGQLVDQKKLSFEDKVGKFFPAYANKTVRDQVTVGMLLSHYAGMGTFLEKRPPEMLKNGVKRAAEFLPILEKEELEYQPGTRQGYSNSGYVLAGAIVEKVSGMDYPDYIRKHIFEPAGMTGSDPNNRPQKYPGLATPYTRYSKDHALDSLEVAEQDLGSPAGGAISTADDLLKFADALRSGKLLSRATLDEMRKPRDKDPKSGHYGYGFGSDEVAGHTFIGHSGGFDGVSTHLALLLDKPYTVVVLSNFDPRTEELMSWTMKQWVAAKKP